MALTLLLAAPAQAQHPASLAAPAPAEDLAPETLMAQELLELMLQHCRAGQAALARQLAQDIAAQLAPTPAIEALLAPVLAGACAAPPPSPRQAELQLSAGWDDNVNLGLLASTVTFSPLGLPITFTLDDSYKPVRSAFASAAGLFQTETVSGWTLQAQAGARQFADYSPLNTLGLQLGARRGLGAAGLPGQLSLGWAETWLGGQRFRSAPSLAWHSLPSRGQQGWSVHLGLQLHDHVGTPFDARQLQAGFNHQLRLPGRDLSHQQIGQQGGPQAHGHANRLQDQQDLEPVHPQARPPAGSTPSLHSVLNTYLPGQHQISWGAGWLHDRALGPRAGGNRQGLQLQAGWQWALQGLPALPGASSAPASQGVWQLQWAWQHWTSAQDFLPGLVDAPRRNTTTTTTLGYQWPLRPGTLLYMEYQRRHSRDSVPLYAHRSNQLAVGAVLRWP